MTEQEITTLAEVDQRSKSNCHRIDGLEEELRDLKLENKAIYKIATSVELMAQKITHLEEKVDETGKKVDAQTTLWREAEGKLSARISEVDNKPSKQIATNMNSIKVSVITAVMTMLATGLVAAFISILK